jgi:hypothetical protein
MSTTRRIERHGRSSASSGRPDPLTISDGTLVIHSRPGGIVELRGHDRRRRYSFAGVVPIRGSAPFGTAAPHQRHGDGRAVGQPFTGGGDPAVGNGVGSLKANMCSYREIVSTEALETHEL